MIAAIPVADMRSGTGELSAAVQAQPPGREAETLSRMARIRLAGNAVAARQAALMLARGLEQLDAIDRKELS